MQIITESHSLRSVAQEKWGTHDALQAQRPPMATTSFGLLISLSDEFPKGKFSHELYEFANDTSCDFKVLDD